MTRTPPGRDPDGGRQRHDAEHGAVAFSSGPFRKTRTTLADPLERLFRAPYWVNCHLEHHLVMHIPARDLPHLHALLVAKGLADRATTAPGYLDVLRQASQKPA